ncbi:MAG: hypothetical protein D6762_08090 [Candidatus Neomarinimicrobiota bacterium]|nr:MAG: hypothetical protein D6762_08090 [Candidatus Neomarinimicrobiota bacterium]
MSMFTAKSFIGFGSRHTERNVLQARRVLPGPIISDGTLDEPMEDRGRWPIDSDKNRIPEFRIGSLDFTYSRVHPSRVYGWEYETGPAVYQVWSNDASSYLTVSRWDIDRQREKDSKPKEKICF